jgi:uncharacterized protein (DUF2236 family)
MRLARHQDKVDESASGIADANDFAAETTPRAAKSLLIVVGVVIESQTQAVANRRIYMMSRDVEGRWLDLHQRETGVSKPID